MKFCNIITKISTRLGILAKENQKQDQKFKGVILINKDLIKIGERVSFGGNVIIFATRSVEIGDDTMIAYNSIIATSSHDYNNHPMWLRTNRFSDKNWKKCMDWIKCNNPTRSYY